MGAHRHIMLKLLLSLVLLLQVGHNHAKLSASSQRRLAVYRKMLEEAEQAGVTPEANAGNDEAYYNAQDAGNNGTANDAVDAKGSGDANNTLAFRTMKNGMDNGLKVENDTDASNDADPGPGPEPEPESARAPAPDPANYQLGKLLSGILGQLTSGNPVKMIVDIKNPEVMIDEEDGTDIAAVPKGLGQKNPRNKELRLLGNLGLLNFSNFYCKWNEHS